MHYEKPPMTLSWVVFLSYLTEKQQKLEAFLAGLMQTFCCIMGIKMISYRRVYLKCLSIPKKILFV